MTFYNKLLVVLILMLSACDNSKSPKLNTKIIEKTQEKDSSLFVEFPSVSKLEAIRIQRKSHIFYKENLNPENFSGQFLVAKYGKVLYYKSNGYSDIKNKIEITSSTPLHVASISKVATSLAVLRLVDQGKIVLDTDVRDYLPELPYEHITIRTLLNHRSGLPYYGYFSNKIWNYRKRMHNKDILKLLIKHKLPLNFKPNTKFSYCNTNFALLALIIERVTEKDFSKAMEELLFEPLKMKNSFILTDEKMFSKVSKSYNSKKQFQEFDYLDLIYGDKNLYTTANDLLLMDKATYSPKFLSDSLQKQMLKGYSYEHSGTSNYGLGIRMKEEKGKETYFFHTGWWHGNTGCYATLRKDTVCIITISNVYTRSVFHINRLAATFGDYPFQFEE